MDEHIYPPTPSNPEIEGGATPPNEEFSISGGPLWAALRVLAQQNVDIARAGAQIQQNEEEQRHRADHDSLTGLLSKASLLSNMQRRIENRSPFGVLFFDLDGFKAVNDTLGHGAGDRLLQAWSAFLDTHFKRQEDVLSREKIDESREEEDDNMVARPGGDEFIGLVGLSGRPDSGERRASHPKEGMAKELLYIRKEADAFFKRVHLLPGLEKLRGMSIGVSIGSAIWTPDMGHTTVEQILDAADKAMYADKQAHEGGR